MKEPTLREASEPEKEAKDRRDDVRPESTTAALGAESYGCEEIIDSELLSGFAPHHSLPNAFCFSFIICWSFCLSFCLSYFHSGDACCQELRERQNDHHHPRVILSSPSAEPGLRHE